MGNSTNDKNWAAMERLRFIESCAWWKGVLRRQDLIGVFGVSMAQSSSDLQRYLEINPSAFVYNVRSKRYEATPEMKCVLTVPNLDEAVCRFLDGGLRSGWSGIDPPGNDRVAILQMPARQAGEQVERRIFQAIFHGYRVHVRYASVNGGKEDWRWLRPHALGHDGARWHARAWCEKNGNFRDFNLSRMAEINWSREKTAIPKKDKDWQTVVTLKVAPHPDLDAAQRKAVERDYAMTGGSLKIKVRKAMEGYLRNRLGIAMAGGDKPALLLREI
jgi:hypothetical protein